MDFHSPCIAFVRTSISFAACGIDLVSATTPSGYPAADGIIGKNTILLPLKERLHDDIEWMEQTFKPEFAEIAAVTPKAGYATPVEIVYTDDEGKDWPELNDFGLPIKERRNSSLVAWKLSTRGYVERPSFGRKLIFVNYDQDVPEIAVERKKEKIRRVLGEPITVWEGRSACGYCFVEHAHPKKIGRRLSGLLDCDEVEDYLVLEIVNMVLANSSGLSRLKDWIEGGYRGQVFSKPKKAKRKGGDAA